MALSVCGKSFLWAVAGLLLLANTSLRAEDLAIKEIPLPPLRIQGQPAKAHTQGMELVDGKVFVTARRDDVHPRRALLLRAEPAAESWEVWDITPLVGHGEPTNLDHPGGMQSDGTRLWIPLAESRRNGRSLIRAYRLKDLEAGRTLRPDVEFPVSDHIGAVAVFAEQRWLLGASWDTEKVYLWDFDGRLLRTLGASELKSRELGVAAGEEARSGLAVQDWKFVGNRLFASGLLRASTASGVATESRLICFSNFMEADFQRRTVKLPLVKGTQLAREAMAISDGFVHFLPEDLGATNRMFRVSLTNWFSDIDR
jgi:hypothetical protein